MEDMLYKCSSLTEIKISNFYVNNAYDIRDIFYECPDELKKKIKRENKSQKLIMILLYFLILKILIKYYFK